MLSQTILSARKWRKSLRNSHQATTTRVRSKNASAIGQMVRWLGAPRWRQLHRLTYVAVGLGAVHFVMQAKGLQIAPLVYLGVAGVLLGLRTLPSGKRLA